jgi:hypothetical protein
MPLRHLIGLARHRSTWLTLAVIGAVIAAGYGLSRTAAPPTPVADRYRESHHQTTWAACNRNVRGARASTFRPLSDAQAAALVTRRPETRAVNARPYAIAGKRYPAVNYYVPTNAELRDFRFARTSMGQPILQFNPYYAYVDGRDGMRSPSTDDLIQWAAHKWGIPEDWLRAEYVKESYWSQFQLGDETHVSARWYRMYPFQARIPHTLDVYGSLGITQVQWAPDGAVGVGAEPLRWKSTAFNIDYQAATVRFYYDDPQGTRSAWGDASYVPCQRWNSIGGWFRPYPWGNGDQQTYINAVRDILVHRVWVTADFLSWRLTAVPPGLKFG